jgi:flagellar biosynthetic protein FliQ
MEPGDRISHEELLPMTPDSVVQIVREALMLAFWVAAPMLAIGFFVGIAISLVQIATSMQDTAFSTVPRLIAFLAGILLLLPWMLQKIMSYTAALLGDLGRYAR